MQRSQGMSEQSSEGFEFTSFPVLPTSVTQPKVDQTLEFHFEKLELGSEWSTSTIVHAAWALVAGRYSNSNDVTFGTYATIPGSKALVNGTHNAIKPEILSVRIRLPGTQALPLFLKKVRTRIHQSTEWGEAEIRTIAGLSENTNKATHFQTIIELQSSPETPNKVSLNGNAYTQSWMKFPARALNLKIIQSSDETSIVASFDSRVVEPWTVQKLVEQLDHVMRQLFQITPKSSKTLDNIDYMTTQQKAEISGWLQEDLPNIERCIHDLIDDRIREQPHALAIDAWDGKLTYGELGDLSTRLAHYLADLGVGPEIVVPLCFKKSLFTARAAINN